MILGYWVLPNIFQYWLVLGTGQYFYWLSYPTPILLGHLDTSCQQMTTGKLGRRLSKARVLANEGTHNEIQQTVILAFITYMVILIAIVMGKLVLYDTCTFVEKSIRCFTLYWYWYWYQVLALGQANIIGYWVLGALLGIILTLVHTACYASYCCRNYKISSHRNYIQLSNQNQIKSNQDLYSAIRSRRFRGAWRMDYVQQARWYR